MAFDDALCRHGDFTSAGGYAAALALLALPPGQRPDGLFCCNDLMAFGALRAAAELGIAVPDQLAVVGFDDIDLASFVHPPLTSVAQNTRELGHITAACLLARIAEPDAALQQQAESMLSAILNELNYVGVMAMECFVVSEGHNELREETRSARRRKGEDDASLVVAAARADGMPDTSRLLPAP